MPRAGPQALLSRCGCMGLDSRGAQAGGRAVAGSPGLQHCAHPAAACASAPPAAAAGLHLHPDPGGWHTGARLLPPLPAACTARGQQAALPTGALRAVRGFVGQLLLQGKSTVAARRTLSAGRCLVSACLGTHSRSDAPACMLAHSARSGRRPLILSGQPLAP